MTEIQFSGIEILDIAIRIEENGINFYKHAIEEADSEDLKSLFVALAGEEQAHKSYFKELKEEYIASNGKNIFSDTMGEDEALLYLNALADTHIFTSEKDGRSHAVTTNSDETAVRIAMELEKDSILFYSEILKVIRAADIGIVEELIDQEKRHLKRLSELLLSLGC